MNEEILVNKENKLPFYYIPSDMIAIPKVNDVNERLMLVQYAYEQFWASLPSPYQDGTCLLSLSQTNKR